MKRNTPDADFGLCATINAHRQRSAIIYTACSPIAAGQKTYRICCQCACLVHADNLGVGSSIQLVRLQCSDSMAPQPPDPYPHGKQDHGRGNGGDSCNEQVNDPLNNIPYVISILVALGYEQAEGCNLEGQGEGTEYEVVLHTVMI